jgi:hypothetical protein
MMLILMVVRMGMGEYEVLMHMEMAVKRAPCLHGHTRDDFAHDGRHE